MKVTLFSSKSYDVEYFERANAEFGHELTFLPVRLDATTCELARDADVVCPFVNDVVNRDVLSKLAEHGTRLIALRSAGYNHVDLAAAEELGLTVVRVPAYSPHAVAEHALALILSLNRHIVRANNRVHDGNFSLEGLLGFDLAGKTVGVVGTGQIGAVVCRILRGFDCEVLATDLHENDACIELGVVYTDFDSLLKQSDIVTLQCPLTPETHHMIDEAAITKMKPGAMLINTSRGALVDTAAVIQALKSRTLGALGIDVYEEESELFFEDLSDHVLTDDVFARLLTFPNVLITGHQAFFTREALVEISRTTLANVTEFEETNTCRNEVATVTASA